MDHAQTFHAEKSQYGGDLEANNFDKFQIETQSILPAMPHARELTLGLGKPLAVLNLALVALTVLFIYGQTR